MLAFSKLWHLTAFFCGWLLTLPQTQRQKYTVSHHSFLLTERIHRFQVGITVHGVGVHAVLKGLHFLNNFLQCRVFDAHVIHGVEQRDTIWEAFLHLLQTKCLEGKKRKSNDLDDDFCWVLPVSISLFQDGCIVYQYRLEHQLPVVKGPQVFGDVKANWANGSQEMEHHWNHLDK